MPAPQLIIDLVERFERNIESYKSNGYNETQVRREFIDPFFEALGWDINNKAGHAEAYKDVIHEDAVKVSGVTKAPDYSFRIGGQRKFFLETKKPSVDIKDDIHPAFQLRRYAWTAKLPLSILTDFEEFSVYDCGVKPDKTDKPSKGRILYLTYQDFLTKWDEIASIFSKNAILKGSFDKFAADKKGKRGTAEVDDAFLEEIAGWREILAKNIALRNPRFRLTAAMVPRPGHESQQRAFDEQFVRRAAQGLEGAQGPHRAPGPGVLVGAAEVHRRLSG